jgi:hypothetical protein
MTNEEKVNHLKELLNNVGWQIIQEELDQDIKITESKLFGEAKLNEGETIDGLRRERIDRLELRNLPENLIRELTDDHQEPSFDVYEEVEEESEAE